MISLEEVNVLDALADWLVLGQQGHHILGEEGHILADQEAHMAAIDLLVVHHRIFLKRIPYHASIDGVSHFVESTCENCDRHFCNLVDGDERGVLVVEGKVFSEKLESICGCSLLVVGDRLQGNGSTGVALRDVESLCVLC